MLQRCVQYFTSFALLVVPLYLLLDPNWDFFVRVCKDPIPKCNLSRQISNVNMVASILLVVCLNVSEQKGSLSDENPKHIMN